ncbi:unnamed protein product [Sphenostylis stenocarpa]|uniref:Gag1-like clamp domain-containing protein n=1 Tax=Sphenostylis stenocarpa TaxID=92480 RepID=A0AA86SVR5_9FABA|nr:unnamed protein product [Sphenostylis stenocarpa]
MFHLGSVRFSLAWGKLDRALQFIALSRIPLKLSRGCLGCFPNPPLIKGQAMNKDISEDFWSSSAFEIDQSAFQSQKSFSSVVIPSDPQSSSGSLLTWNQMRRHWVGNRRPENKKEVGEPVIRCKSIFNTRKLMESWNWSMTVGFISMIKVTSQNVCLVQMLEFLLYSWNATYESLMGTDKPFPRPIPLGEMVDFLGDIWELEGLYD